MRRVLSLHIRASVPDPFVWGAVGFTFFSCRNLACRFESGTCPAQMDKFEFFWQGCFPGKSGTWVHPRSFQFN